MGKWERGWGRSCPDKDNEGPKGQTAGGQKAKQLLFCPQSCLPPAKCRRLRAFKFIQGGESPDRSWTDCVGGPTIFSLRAMGAAGNIQAGQSGPSQGFEKADPQEFQKSLMLAPVPKSMIRSQTIQIGACITRGPCFDLLPCSLPVLCAPELPQTPRTSVSAVVSRRFPGGPWGGSSPIYAQNQWGQVWCFDFWLSCSMWRVDGSSSCGVTACSREVRRRDDAQAYMVRLMDPTPALAPGPTCSALWFASP